MMMIDDDDDDGCLILPRILLMGMVMVFYRFLWESIEFYKNPVLIFGK